jgi:hypothetical protein
MNARESKRTQTLITLIASLTIRNLFQTLERERKALPKGTESELGHAHGVGEERWFKSQPEHQKAANISFLDAVRDEILTAYLYICGHQFPLEI